MSDTTLTGRLTADPELKYLASGKAMAKFTVATSRRVLNKDIGQWEDKDTTFWRCTAFDQLAENACEHLLKGMAVIILGDAYERPWEDKNGQQRSSLEVNVRYLGEDIRWRKARGESRQRPAQDDEPPF